MGENCPICGCAAVGMLEYHCARYHRYDPHTHVYECNYCQREFASTETDTHGMETCVLCSAQFQHANRDDWWCSYIWGKVKSTSRTRFYGCTIEHPRELIKSYITINGTYLGEAYSLRNIPEGAICAKCLDIPDIVHVWSH